MTVLDLVPVERISAQARDTDISRVILTVLAGFFYAIGWVAGKVVTFLWQAISWSAVAIKVGWMDARKPAGGPPRESR